MPEHEKAKRSSCDYEEWLSFARCDLEAAYRLISDEEAPLIYPALVLA